MRTPCVCHQNKPRPNGYVRITVDQKSWYAHRFAWTQAHGPIPDGLDVCHRCDNRRCINVDHLYLGTRLDNMLDAKQKGRTAKGFALPQTKLSEQDVAEIVRRAKQGERYSSIAESFNVCRQRVGQLAIQQGVRRNAIIK